VGIITAESNGYISPDTDYIKKLKWFYCFRYLFPPKIQTIPSIFLLVLKKMKQLNRSRYPSPHKIDWSILLITGT
jgi:hypothetical protein